MTKRTVHSVLAPPAAAAESLVAALPGPQSRRLQLALLTAIGFGGGSMLGWAWGLVQHPDVTGSERRPGN